MGLVKQRLLLAVGSLICVAVCLRTFAVFSDTEFGGGRLALTRDRPPFCS
jgi:hypothetical protein